MFLKCDVSGSFTSLLFFLLLLFFYPSYSSIWRTRKVPWSTRFTLFILFILLLLVLFQETALEVFSSDGRNHFLVFPKPVRSKVYDK